MSAVTGTRRPTKTASAQLRDLMKSPLFVPGPLTGDEEADFMLYLSAHAVPFRRSGEGIQADRDLCPSIWAWRIERGEVAA